MKKLILVRHGNYIGRGDFENPLSEEVCEQIKILSEKIKSVINNGSVLIFSSPAIRTLQSAEIISNKLSVGFEKHEALFYNEFLEILDLLDNNNNIDLIILVAHLEEVVDFQKFFNKKRFNSSLPFVSAQKGEAIIIDCENKTTELISYK